MKKVWLGAQKTVEACVGPPIAPHHPLGHFYNHGEMLKGTLEDGFQGSFLGGNTSERANFQ